MNDKNLNKKRIEAIKVLQNQFEQLINNTELFCPHDCIVITQGRVEIFSGQASVRLEIKD